MIEFKTKYSRALLSNVQYLEIDEGVNLVLKRMVIIRRVYFEVKMNDIEILIPWGSLSMQPYLSINDLIYELFKLKNSVRDVRHIRHMNYKIKGYKSALQMIFLIYKDDAFGRTSHRKHDSSNTCFH